MLCLSIKYESYKKLISYAHHIKLNCNSGLKFYPETKIGNKELFIKLILLTFISNVDHHYPNGNSIVILLGC